MKKKILSLAMACVMVMSCCSIVAMAACKEDIPTTMIETNDGVIFEIIDGDQDNFDGGNNERQLCCG